MSSGGSFVPPGGSKNRLVLRPVKPAGLDHSQAVAHWEHLRAAFGQIHAQNASSLSYEELYRYAYNLVLHKHGELLYEGVCTTIKSHLAGEAARVRASPDELLLARLRSCWDAHRRDMRMISDVLMYMDRTYVPQHRKMIVLDQGTVAFRDVVARNVEIRARVTKLLLAAVADARAGRLLNADLVRSVLHMLVDLGLSSLTVYQEEFESHMLRETEVFYRVEAASKCATGSCSEYLAYADARLEGETTMVHSMMPAASSVALLTCVRRLLIAEHAVQLIEMEGSGLIPMLERGATADLRRMYHLFAQYKSTVTWRPPQATADRASTPSAILRDSIKHHIQTRGLAVVTDAEQRKDAATFIQALLDLRDKYAGVIDDAFGGDKDFHRAVKEAFEFVVNYTDPDSTSATPTSCCAEFLALYVDENMKTGFRGLSEEDIDDRLTKVIALFRFIRDKDVFEAYYKQLLTKRLLGGRVSSDDAEKAMISKLKAECGFQFTSKLEGMFNDLRISQEFMRNFRRDRGAVAAGGVDVDVTVLTSGTWPGDVPPPCSLPREVAMAAQTFSTYYLGKHSGRRLAWHTAKGTADVKFFVDGTCRHELVVSTYQMCILMLFNDVPCVSYKRMAAALSIPAEELKRHLLSLAAPKAGRLLNKSNKVKKDVDEDETYDVNAEFSSKMLKVKIPLISIKSVAAAAASSSTTASGGAASASSTAASAAAAADGADIPAHIEEARRIMLDAAIVRIMKARKSMDHNALVMEVMKQVASRFHPLAADIKKRIEALIDREYLERDESTKSVYTYVA